MRWHSLLMAAAVVAAAVGAARAQGPELIVEPRPHRDVPTGTEEPRGPAPYRADHASFWKSIDGYTDSPAAASAEFGQAAFDAVIPAVADAFVAFHAEAAAARS